MEIFLKPNLISRHTCLYVMIDRLQCFSHAWKDWDWLSSLASNFWLDIAFQFYTVNKIKYYFINCGSIQFNATPFKYLHKNIWKLSCSLASILLSLLSLPPHDIWNTHIVFQNLLPKLNNSSLLVYFVGHLVCVIVARGLRESYHPGDMIKSPCDMNEEEVISLASEWQNVTMQRFY
jgi:hypothetical protein